MATPTYTAIESTTLSSSASSVTFSGLDQSYGDLILIVEAENVANSATGVELYFNGDTSSSSYYRVHMTGTGSSTSTAGGETATFLITSSTVRSLNRIDIMDYSTTDKHKPIMGFNADTSFGIRYFGGTFRSTAAISSIEISPSPDSFAIGTKITIYGVAK